MTMKVNSQPVETQNPEGLEERPSTEAPTIPTGNSMMTQGFSSYNLNENPENAFSGGGSGSAGAGNIGAPGYSDTNLGVDGSGINLEEYRVNPNADTLTLQLQLQKFNEAIFLKGIDQEKIQLMLELMPADDPGRARLESQNRVIDAGIRMISIQIRLIEGLLSSRPAPEVNDSDLGEGDEEESAITIESERARINNIRAGAQELTGDEAAKLETDLTRLETQLDLIEGAPNDEALYEVYSAISTLATNLVLIQEDSIQLREWAEQLDMTVEDLSGALDEWIDLETGEIDLPNIPTEGVIKALAGLDPEIAELSDTIESKTELLKADWDETQDAMQASSDDIDGELTHWASGLKGQVEKAMAILKHEDDLSMSIMKLKTELRDKILEKLKVIYPGASAGGHVASEVNFVNLEWINSDKIKIGGQVYDVYGNNSHQIQFKRSDLSSKSFKNSYDTEKSDIWNEIDDEGDYRAGIEDEKGALINLDNDDNMNTVLKDETLEITREDDELDFLRDPKPVALNSSDEFNNLDILGIAWQYYPISFRDGYHV